MLEENIDKRGDIKIQILMSTYNGGKYLREQLDSILNQKGNFKIQILVRDDGSSDNTIEILEEYSKKITIKIIKGKNIGVNLSLKELIEKSDINCDYFAISDQDDIWLENKLEKAIVNLEKNSFDGMKLFASMSYVTDINMKILGKTQDPGNKVSCYNAMIQNICPGHTQVFNKEVVLELKKNYSENIFVIDWWIYLLVSTKGKLIFHRECTVMHRQHGLNSAGYELDVYKKLKKRLKNLKKYKKNPVSKQLESFFEIYKNDLKLEYVSEMKKFLENQLNFFSRLRYVINSKVFRYGFFENFLFKLLYIFGRYKI